MSAANINKRRRRRCDRNSMHLRAIAAAHSQKATAAPVRARPPRMQALRAELLSTLTQAPQVSRLVALVR
jgi:hypothetical protein